MPSNGIDVSEYQNPSQVRGMTGLDFLIAKASQGHASGGGFADPEYEAWKETAGHLGIHFGAYHFFRAEYLNARAQADYFTSTVRPESGMSLWLDYETYGVSGQHDAEEIGYFIREVQYNTSNKAKVGIYCDGEGLSRIKPYLFEIPYKALWFADPSHEMTVQSASPAWQVHQYEVYQGIDRNYSAWSPAEWAGFWEW